MSTTYTADRDGEVLRISSSTSGRSIHLTDAEWDAVRQAAHFQDQLDEVLEDITNTSSKDNDLVQVLRGEIAELERASERHDSEKWDVLDKADEWERRYDNLLDRVLSGSFVGAPKEEY